MREKWVHIDVLVMKSRKSYRLKDFIDVLVMKSRKSYRLKDFIDVLVMKSRKSDSLKDFIDVLVMKSRKSYSLKDLRTLVHLTRTWYLHCTLKLLMISPLTVQTSLYSGESLGAYGNRGGNFNMFYFPWQE